MKVEGKITKSGKLWIAEIEMFDLYIQGKTKKETIQTAKEVIKDLVEVTFENHVPADFIVSLETLGKDHFFISFSDVQIMTAFILKRMREKQGLPVREVVRTLGARSTNAYFDYERLRRKPTLAKFEQLLHAIAPNHHIYLS